VDDPKLDAVLARTLVDHFHEHLTRP